MSILARFPLRAAAAASCLTVMALLRATNVFALPAYSVQSVVDPATGNLERRFLADSFHFGSLILDPHGRIAFRPHPYPDPNGWGSTLYLAPFLAGADARDGAVDAVVVAASGISLEMRGEIARSATLTFGTWSYGATIGYDPMARRIEATGVLAIRLDGLLALAGRDLNLGRIASNYLHDVPLQGGGHGDTGDMSAAVIRYGAGAGSHNLPWDPPALPATFPTDASAHLAIDVGGAYNDVDTLALGAGFQIAPALKPSLRVTFDAMSGDPLSAGMLWNALLGRNFAADNVGITPLLLVGNNLSTALDYRVSFTSMAPVPEPSAWALMASGCVLVAGMGWRRARVGPAWTFGRGRSRSARASAGLHVLA